MINIEERSTEKRSFFSRLVVIYIFFIFLFTFLLFRTYSLQVSSYTDYELASLKNRTRDVWFNQQEELSLIEMETFL